MSLMDGMVLKDELRQIRMEVQRIAYKSAPPTRATKHLPRRYKNLGVRCILTTNLYISGQHYTQEYIIDTDTYSLVDGKLEENPFAHKIRGQTLLSQLIGIPCEITLMKRLI